ncbi:hypothetical protein N6L27_03680 [Leisingera sp. SS27]|uniref:hypothetical protein n=1 Tax=Leisingera sp. SS27 TaxID=2979462 RepID=UPI0023307499|nr:hypothetical protein [Leisingera sp. SS27]MDC0657091.1 hypothetical protein [Leisingera sp. SS27]
MKADPKRVERCIIALHDLGSRSNASRNKVMKALQNEGFTDDEIREAATKMLGGDTHD